MASTLPNILIVLSLIFITYHNNRKKLFGIMKVLLPIQDVVFSVKAQVLKS